MTITREILYKEFTPKIEAGEAAFFIGAGFSQSVGFANWKELLRGLAEEIGLDVERETDLIALAQYYENERKRSRINEVLITEYGRDAKPHKNHTLLAQLPVHTVWTTNYDRLLEDGYRSVHKRVDLKITEKNLTQSKPGRDVTLYKMHGDIEQPQDAVLTRRDYDLFHRNRGLFAEALKGDFISKTFLFFGFSFTDPNIDYVLSRIHVLLDKNVREHFCIMRRPQKPEYFEGKAKEDHEYETRKLEHRITDLKQYGIQIVLIDQYEEITEILTELNLRSHGKNVFVSGSAHTKEPLGPERFDDLCNKLGRQIIQNKLNLVSGLGRGIGMQVLSGALEEIYRGDDSISERLSLYPFPRSVPEKDKKATYSRYRREMLSSARHCIFLSGNKLVDGKVIEGPGIQEEFDLCVEQRLFPIPIGATGYASRRFWELVSTDPQKYYGMDSVKIRSILERLGDSNQSNDDLVTDVVALIKLLNRQ